VRIDILPACGKHLHGRIVSLRGEGWAYKPAYDFRIKTTFGSSLPPNDVLFVFTAKQRSVRLYLQFFVEWLMSYLRYLCLHAHSGVQHIVFCLRLVYPICQFLWIVQFLTASSVISKVYLTPPLFIEVPVPSQ